MKKILCVLLSATLAVCGLASCGSAEVSGKEIAKLLLANERLDATVLTEREGIASADIENLSSVLKKPVPVTLASLNGSDYGPNTDMLNYFNSFLEEIERSTEKYAGFISAVKEDINVTDVWIEMGEELLLKVDAGTETIFVRDGECTSICHRYTDQNGKNVYEMYEKLGTFEIYMLFVEDERYEFTYKENAENTTNIVIEKSRGYWNMFTVYDAGEGKNTQTLVSTGDSAFTYHGYINDSGYEFGQLVTLMDEGMNSDVVNVTGPDGTGVEIFVGAFSGIGNITTDADNAVTSVTIGSNTINAQDMFEEYGIRFNGGAEHQAVVNTVNLLFETQETDATSAVLKVYDLLSDLGAKCKYNMNSIADDANGAVALAKSFPQYYTWQGIKIENSASVNSAEEKVWEKAGVLYSMYEEVKDAKKVQATSKGAVFDGYSFATVDSLSSGNITVEDGTVLVSGLSMKLSNLEVFDQGENYAVNLALAKLDSDSAAKYENVSGNIDMEFITLCDVVTLSGSSDADYTAAVLMEKEGGELAAYSSGGSFSLTQSATFTLPECDEYGVYTLVAYAATEDGIRVSEMAPVSLSSDVSYEKETDGVTVKMQLNEFDELIVSYSVNIVSVTVENKSGGYTYAEVKELLDNAVLEYGYPADNAVVELCDSSGGSTAADTSATFSDCILRINYQNKLSNSEDHVYLIIQ